MRKRLIYEMKGMYRDPFRITGYEFGSGHKALCIVGNSRGNEVQQIYCCSQLIRKCRQLEEEGRIAEGHKILIIPSINPYSMNIQKRFWSTDNTDINRMFPGYDLGETTQRIAAAVFKEIEEFDYGIQFTSFYMPGDFVPHVRYMDAGYSDYETAQKFGLPYIVERPDPTTPQRSITTGRYGIRKPIPCTLVQPPGSTGPGREKPSWPS